MEDTLNEALTDIASTEAPLAGIALGADAIAKMTEYGIPDYMQYGLISYFEKRQPVGDFLTALLENDLMGAFMVADDTNKECMSSYVMWLYNCPPGRSPSTWGSPTAVAHWLSGGQHD